METQYFVVLFSVLAGFFGPLLYGPIHQLWDLVVPLTARYMGIVHVEEYEDARRGGIYLQIEKILDEHGWFLTLRWKEDALRGGSGWWFSRKFRVFGYMDASDNINFNFGRISINGYREDIELLMKQAKRVNKGISMAAKLDQDPISLNESEHMIMLEPEISTIKTLTFQPMKGGRCLVETDEEYIPINVPPQSTIVDRLQQQYERLCTLEGVSKSVMALITGPPGTSKSDVGRVLATRYPGSTLVLRYSPVVIGTNYASIIQRRAEHLKPIIIMIEEFDTVLESIHSGSKATLIRDELADATGKSELVELLDSLSRCNNVFVIFTSNKPLAWFQDELYQYAVRDSRMHFHIELPELNDCDRDIVITGAMQKYRLSEDDVDRVQLQEMHRVGQIDNYMRKRKLF
jgi:hypothetical protein